ncbi:MAG: RNA-binding S4 domain-containing protein [Aerococcus sp.]|nr:RNA-binding S4 domain-containing protein [Aerococcus sp.]
MRLDKFLKVARIIKRRQVAKEVADQGRVQINGHVAKSGAQVSVGDEIMIEFGNKISTFKVTDIKESTKKQDAEQMFKLVHEELKPKDDQGPEFFA